MSTQASEGAIWSANCDDARHRRIAEQEVGDFPRHGGDDRGDQLGVGRQRDVFLGAGADGVDRGGGIGLGAAGDDRDVDALAIERGDEAGDVDHHVDQQQIGAAAGPEAREGDVDGRGVGDLGAALHGELGGFGELAVEGADDQETHGVLLGRLDDFGHGDAEPVLDEDDLAAGDEPVVDVDFDGLADLAVELDDGADVHLQQARDRHPGAAEDDRDADRDVEDRLEIGGGAFATGSGRRVAAAPFPRGRCRPGSLAIIGPSFGLRAAPGGEVGGNAAIDLGFEGGAVADEAAVGPFDPAVAGGRGRDRR